MGRSDFLVPQGVAGGVLNRGGFVIMSLEGVAGSVLSRSGFFIVLYLDGVQSSQNSFLRDSLADDLRPGLKGGTVSRIIRLWLLQGVHG